MNSQPQDVQAILQRIDALEKQNRSLIRAGLFALLFVAAMVTMGQARPSRTVEAEQFVLRDSQGRQRLVIGTPRNSGVAFDLAPDEPAIWIMGENGVDRAILSGDGLGFADEKGKRQARVEISKTGSALDLYDLNGKERIKLSGESTNPSVFISDKDGFARVSSGLINEQPSIIVNDRQGFVAQLGITDLVTSRTGEQHRTSAASFVLLGKDGKVLWSAP